MPWLDLVWTKNPIVQRLSRAKPNPIVNFAVARMKERQTHMENAYLPNEELKKTDFLSQFLEIIQKDRQIPHFALTA